MMSQRRPSVLVAFQAPAPDHPLESLLVGGPPVAAQVAHPARVEPGPPRRRGPRTAAHVGLHPHLRPVPTLSRSSGRRSLRITIESVELSQLISLS